MREGEGAGQEGGVEESEGGGRVRRRRRRRGEVRRRRGGRMRERGGGISAGWVDGQVVVSFKRATGALGSDGCALVCATNARVECELLQQVPKGDGLGWGCCGANGELGGGIGRAVTGGHEGES